MGLCKHSVDFLIDDLLLHVLLLPHDVVPDFLVDQREFLDLRLNEDSVVKLLLLQFPTQGVVLLLDDFLVFQENFLLQEPLLGLPVEKTRLLALSFIAHFLKFAEQLYSFLGGKKLLIGGVVVSVGNDRLTKLHGNRDRVLVGFLLLAKLEGVCTDVFGLQVQAVGLEEHD